MSDNRTDIEKIPASEIVQEEIPELYPRYPGIAGNLNTGSYGYGNGQGEEDKVHLREVWRIIRRRKWMIATIALIATTLVTIDMYRARSVYEASTLVEIGKEKAVLNRPDAMVYQDDFDPYYQVNIKTKILILRSPALMEDVVVRHKLYNEPALLNSGGKKSISEALGLISSKLTGKNFIEPPGEKVNLAPLDNFLYTGSVEDSEKLRPYVGVVQGGLDIQPIRETRAIRISYTHTDPRMARLVADAVTDSFLKKNFENKTEKFEQTAGWLETSMRELKAKVEKAEEALAKYTREHQIFSTDGKQTLTTDKLSRLHEASLKAASDRTIKQSLLEEVKAGRVKELPEAFASLANQSGTKLVDLQKQLSDLESKKAVLDTKYGPEFPEVKDTNQKIETIRQQIAANSKTLEQSIQIEYDRAVRDEQSIKQQLERAKGEAVQQNQDSIQYNILNQDVEINKQLYRDFLNKTNQAKLQVAEQENNLRLIQGAQLPGGPSGPNRYRSIMMGLMLSLGAGIGLAFLLEYMNNTIKTVEDVARYAQLPALSVIPSSLSPASRLSLVKKKSKALTNGKLQTASGDLALRSAQLTVLDSRSSAAEAYRVLRTSVLLSTAGHAPKLILITSGQPGEGKTTTVANTAISLAQLGASVLIIDCDMRRPTMHKVFGVDNLSGLSTYLSRNIDVDELIQKLPIEGSNVSLLPSGSIPPNPAELISSERMKEMLEMLSERYDHILIDSPPLINVTDPVILSTMVDGVILVVQSNKTSRDIVRRARQELATVGAKIFGVVLNNVDLRRDGYSDYYYYRYYSGYGKDEAAGD